MKWASLTPITVTVLGHLYILRDFVHAQADL